MQPRRPPWPDFLPLGRDDDWLGPPIDKMNYKAVTQGDKMLQIGTNVIPVGRKPRS
ncbi:hypothetical protein [Paracoccus shanxieyensis]|uniref:Uncharacterized protein n=1 Tax=Paracoccus shanxieyensis TaxID=2675752 RepID=A0A6L6J506_9RHOB|nr:hypothetical protein [Paracoccus shanxieyensis]MTH65857.1 hypothetical protein [Paracoccus shanxieyensis]MTH89234.1 hypothetical protein [Paracoccus shanxieyensis]